MKIFIGCASKDTNREEYREDARYIAKSLAKNNDLVYGTSNTGLMGIVYDEFKKQNRKIIGIYYPMYNYSIDDLKLDKVLTADFLGMGTNYEIEEADSLLFLPGAYGTFLELIMALELQRSKMINKKIVIYNPNHYFDGILENINRSYLDAAASNNYQDLCIVLEDKDQVIKEFM